jgi:hypothetical protein
MITAAGGRSAPSAGEKLAPMISAEAAESYVAATTGDISVASAGDDRELMKVISSILDCSIMLFTLGENLTPEENSLVSLLISGPLEVEFLVPSSQINYGLRQCPWRLYHSAIQCCCYRHYSITIIVRGIIIMIRSCGHLKVTLSFHFKGDIIKAICNENSLFG